MGDNLLRVTFFSEGTWAARDREFATQDELVDAAVAELFAGALIHLIRRHEFRYDVHNLIITNDMSSLVAVLLADDQLRHGGIRHLEANTVTIADTLRAISYGTTGDGSSWSGVPQG